jgi:peptidoglycan/LPS O-acetylase OafA/YrhL
VLASTDILGAEHLRRATMSIYEQLRAERSTGFRPDIEGVRAIAVVAVMLYHSDLGPFSGGYVGVDVFFVVSGFLITRLLIRDLNKLGGRSLPNFWARRARRLLPASGLLILVTLLVGWFALDPLAHRSLGRDAVAAGAFVANIVFAQRDGDYFASELSPSPLLHFWSLAVEEQFYLVWPMILLVVVRVRSGKRTALIWTIGVLWAASFVTSIWLTNRSAPWAFYLLPTRAWELLSGAAIAVAAPTLASKLSSATLAVLGWCGLAAIGGSIVLLTPSASFPGWIALWPVAGAVAVVVAGVGPAQFGPASILGSAPMLWIGQRSYGIYLWHWPALVLGAAAWGPLVAWERLALLAVSVVVAAGTYTIFENPIRRLEWLAFRPSRSLLAGAALVVVVIGFGTLAQQIPRELDAGTVAAAATITIPAPVTTAVPTAAPPESVVSTSTSAPAPAEIDDPVDLAEAFESLVVANRPGLQEALFVTDVPANLRPSLSEAAADKPLIYDNGCMLTDGNTQPPPCIFGDASSSTRIVLFGDSHAAQWFPAMHRIADSQGWRLETITKVGCPTAEVPTTRTDRDPECATWRDAAVERLALSDVDLIVMSSYRYNPGGLADEPWRTGLDATMSELRPTADRVLVLGDTPTPVPSDVPSCLAQNLRRATECNAPRGRSIVEPRVNVEREIARAHDALFAPTGDWLCTDAACPVMFGDVLLYRDGNHISTEAAVLLLPYLEATIAAALDTDA